LKTFTSQISQPFSKNDSQSIADTEEDADKITTEDVKTYDI